MTETIREGDRVRVTFDTEWTGADANADSISNIDGTNTSVGARTNIKVEKIEPPVEQFRPGDVVRFNRYATNGPVFTLGTKGFTRHGDGETFHYGDDGRSYYRTLEQFTSAEFEKVNV